MRFSCCFLVFCVLLSAGLMLGCSEGGSGKPMKDLTVKPGEEKAAEREAPTKDKKKPQPGIPTAPKPPD
jgi:hypothetical protein